MLSVMQDHGIAAVTLDRPEARNALNAALIAAFRDTIARLGADDTVRVIVVTGAGESFCAGADIATMRDAAQLSEEENIADARNLAAMLGTLDRCPKPTIARVNGAAIGGGAGLVACCDLAIAADRAQFAFTEVRLGIAPAVISPFVVAKIGPSQARALFLTGERFDAAHARAIGLVHEVVPVDNLDAAIARQADNLLHGGPHAQTAIKALVRDVAAGRAGTDETAALIAHLRTSPEGQEGLRSFLERRPPAWKPKDLDG